MLVVLLASTWATLEPAKVELTCDAIRGWYTDEVNGGSSSCCLLTGTAGPNDLRQLPYPQSDYARLIFQQKSRPVPWHSNPHVVWDESNTTAVVTLDSINDLGAFLHETAMITDSNDIPYMLIPRTPVIHLHVKKNRDIAGVVPTHYPYAVFRH